MLSKLFNTLVFIFLAVTAADYGLDYVSETIEQLYNIIYI